MSQKTLAVYQYKENKLLECIQCGPPGNLTEHNKRQQEGGDFDVRIIYRFNRQSRKRKAAKLFSKQCSQPVFLNA